MKRHSFLLLFLTMLGILGMATSSIAPHCSRTRVRYSIVRPSSLLLKGTTNVNKFTCACEDQFGFQELEVEAGHATSKFYNARLSMTTRKFNCKNGQMERDLQKALKAETYPKILIDLMEARYSPEYLKKNNTGWFDVEARVVLSIAGTTKEKSIQAQAKRISENRFVLKGAKAVRMTEFGIEPPTAMFGLIQVDDLITFHFELTIQVEPLVFH